MDFFLSEIRRQNIAWWAKFMSVNQKCMPSLMNGGSLKEVLNWVWQNMKYENVEYKIWKYAFTGFLSRFEALGCWDNCWTALGLTNQPTFISDQRGIYQPLLPPNTHKIVRWINANFNQSEKKILISLFNYFIS